MLVNCMLRQLIFTDIYLETITSKINADTFITIYETETPTTLVGVHMKTSFEN